MLKYPGVGPYYGVNFAVNAAWTHERGLNPFEGLAQAMRADPALRLFWAAGYYDLTTPAYAGRYTLDQVGVPPGQLTAAYFAGPHGVYEGEESLKRFTDAVRAFVARSGLHRPRRCEVSALTQQHRAPTFTARSAADSADVA